jgi:hypothetical protein
MFMFLHLVTTLIRTFFRRLRRVRIFFEACFVAFIGARLCVISAFYDTRLRSVDGHLMRGMSLVGSKSLATSQIGDALAVVSRLYRRHTKFGLDQRENHSNFKRLDI